MWVIYVCFTAESAQSLINSAPCFNFRAGRQQPLTTKSIRSTPLTQRGCSLELSQHAFN
jgi:hypothetical protein